MLNKKKIYAGVFLTVFGICLFGFIWSWIVTKDIRSNSVSDEVKNRRVTVGNLVLTETKDEKVYWELYAKKGSYEATTGLVVLENAMGNFYNKENEVVLSVESSRGTYKEDEKIITLEGDTLIVAKDGYSIQADKIVWKGRDEDIVASGNVLVKSKDMFEARSEKAIFNYDFTKFRIEGKCISSIFDTKKDESTGKKSSFNLSLGGKK
jgi:LPS export ABC transporter protein LptC